MSNKYTIPLYTVDYQGNVVTSLPGRHQLLFGVFGKLIADLQNSHKDSIEDLLHHSRIPRVDKPELLDSALAGFSIPGKRFKVKKKLREKINQLTSRYSEDITGVLSAIPIASAWYPASNVDLNPLSLLLQQVNYQKSTNPGFEHEVFSRRVNLSDHVDTRVILDQDSIMVKYTAFGFRGDKVDMVLRITDKLDTVLHYHLEVPAALEQLREHGISLSEIRHHSFEFKTTRTQYIVKWSGGTEPVQVFGDSVSQYQYLFLHEPVLLAGEAGEKVIDFVVRNSNKFHRIYREKSKEHS